MTKISNGTFKLKCSNLANSKFQTLNSKFQTPNSVSKVQKSFKLKVSKVQRSCKLNFSKVQRSCKLEVQGSPFRISKTYVLEWIQEIIYIHGHIADVLILRCAYIHYRVHPSHSDAQPIKKWEWPGDEAFI